MIEQFLANIERKAYQMALMATKNEHDALDLVQNAMMKLVEKYHHKPENELKPLFYAILQNQIKEWYRRATQTSKWFFWQKTAYDDEEELEVTITQGVEETSPEDDMQQQQMSEQLLNVLEQLPVKQQQCFLLRSWEGLSVKETAKVMGCSEGSVKTHMSRASHKLAEIINEQEV